MMNNPMYGLMEQINNMQNKNIPVMNLPNIPNIPQNISSNFYNNNMSNMNSMNSMNNFNTQLPYLYGNMPMTNLYNMPAMNNYAPMTSLPNHNQIPQINNSNFLEALLLLKSQQQQQQQSNVNSFLNPSQNQNQSNTAYNRNLPHNFTNDFMHKRQREEYNPYHDIYKGQNQNNNLSSENQNKDLITKLQHNNINVNLNNYNNNFQSAEMVQQQNMAKDELEEEGGIIKPPTTPKESSFASLVEFAKKNEGK
jgi:hypothetical protein